jgi:ParB-like chromosome segregation protein Spo0J
MSAKRIRAAFEPELLILPLASLLPTKEVTDRVKQSGKYRCIAATLGEVGLVEPLVVYRKPHHHGRHLLLDGHLRRTILMEKGETDVECLLAEDDEAFTYNKRINRLAVVQEHFMIVRAIERGISEARLAKALDVKIDYVKRRRSLLKGVCAEAISLLRDKPVNPVVFDVLRKMKPARQSEACKLMVSASTDSSAYAKSLLTATRDDCLVKPRRRSPPPIVTSADLALMERELKTAQEDFRAVEASYGNDMVNLVIATRYVSSLLGRPRIVRYLDENHPEMLAEFRTILSATSMESPRQKRIKPDHQEPRASANAPQAAHASATVRAPRRRPSKVRFSKEMTGRARPSRSEGTGTLQ